MRVQVVVMMFQQNIKKKIKKIKKINNKIEYFISIKEL